ncbi:MAG: VOC family protein [Pseudomonadota bacterium]
MTDWKAPGRSTVCPMIYCREAEKAIDFAKEVFGAEETGARLYRETGELWNAEVRIGEITILVGEDVDGMGFTPFLYVYVPDVEATYEKAIAAGGEPIMPPDERFYGARDGGVRDPQGNVWWVGTHVADLTPAEIEAGARKMEAARKGDSA